MVWIFVIIGAIITFGLWCCLKVAKQADDRYDKLFKERYGHKDDKLK